MRVVLGRYNAVVRTGDTYIVGTKKNFLSMIDIDKLKKGLLKIEYGQDRLNSGMPFDALIIMMPNVYATIKEIFVIEEDEFYDDLPVLRVEAEIEINNHKYPEIEFTNEFALRSFGKVMSKDSKIRHITRIITWDLLLKTKEE